MENILARMELARYRDKKRFILMLCGILGLGVFLSLLIQVNYGTDACSFMNLSVSARLGILFGTMAMMVHIICFMPELMYAPRHIGPGTIFNMVLIGYIADFCRMLWSRYLPQYLFTENPWRPIVFVSALIPFLFFAALYMNADMGLAPYDSVPMIVSDRFHLPFAPVRIAWDGLMAAIGICMGGHLTLATVILTLSIGPAVSFVGARMKKIFA